MDILAPHREKWREVPGGDDDSPRFFSTDILAMPDAEFLSFWEFNAAKRTAGSLNWLGPMYRDFFTGRRVLELGSGLGFDGLRFAAQGAKWTFADIVPDNLKLIERVASLKGLSVKTFLIREDLSFDSLGGQYDAILASGSMHHVPFEVAREECLSALRLLKPGGRWIELAYPKERWINEGSPPFDQWGKGTDGERTPWAEWYDADKLRARLGPATFSTVLDFNFCNDTFRWFDFIYAPEQLSRQPVWPPKPTLGQRLRAARAAMSDWSYINRVVGAGVIATDSTYLPPDPSTTEERLPDSFLELPWLQDGASIRGQTAVAPHTPVSVVDSTIDTTTVPHVYSLLWKLDTSPLPQSARYRTIEVEMSIDVDAGQLGILWADQDFQPLAASERFVAAEPHQQQVLVSAPAGRARYLVVRNSSPEGIASSFVVRRLRGKIT